MNNKPKQQYKVTYSPLVVFLIVVSLFLMIMILPEWLANLFRVMGGLTPGAVPDFIPMSSVIALYTYPVALAFFIVYTIAWFFIKYNDRSVRIIFWIYISLVILINLSIGITAFNEVYNTPPGGYSKQGFTL